MRSLAGALALLAALAAPSAHAAPLASCYAEVSLEPERVFPGQQVVYRVRIFRREGVVDVKWLEPPSFPSFRAEWLPGHAPDPKIGGIGSHYLILEERRALFPVRSGELSVPAARARCQLDENGARSDWIVPVAPVTLTVVPLPLEGRPADFDGLIGPIQLLVTQGREQIELGETVSVTVTVRGHGNVWRAGPGLVRAFEALESSGAGAVDVFASRPELVFDPGPRLGVRLAARVDLVPRRPGVLTIPPVRVAYFDPERDSYRVARTAATRVQVAERAERRAEEPPPAETTVTAKRDADGSGSSGARGVWIAALAALAGLALVAFARWARPLEREVRRHLADAERASSPREACAALARALRTGLASKLPGARALAADEIVARCETDERAREVAELLSRVEALRFDAESPEARHAQLPTPSEVRRVLLRLRQAKRAVSRRRTKSPGKRSAQ